MMKISDIFLASGVLTLVITIILLAFSKPALKILIIATILLILFYLSGSVENLLA